MNKVCTIYLAAMICCLSGAQTCTKGEEKVSEKQLLPKNDSGAHAALAASCREDEDCTTVKADCCGCRQGGKQKAIAKDQAQKAKEELKSRCSGVMCIQAISTDPSCNKNSSCKSGGCVLE